MIGNFIVLFRKFIKWEWYTNINVKTLFIHCLLSANWETRKWQGFTIERGSFITSWQHLADDTGLSIQQVRTACKKLENTGELTRKQQGTNSIITVNNYNQYQNFNRDLTDKQQDINRDITTTNNINNNNNNNNKTNDINVFNPDFTKIFKIFSDNCTKLIKLTYEKRSRKILEMINDFLIEIDYDFDYFERLCRKANELEFIVDNRIDFRSLIRNHIGIMNGKYEKRTFSNAQQRKLEKLKEMFGGNDE